MKNKGGITVFLSLILLLVFSLLGTVIELSRGKVCQVHSRRTLRVAAECLMAEYSRPLYEQYHLFFLEDIGVPMEESIARYAADTMEPAGTWGSVLDLYDGMLSQVQVKEKQYIGENGGEALQQQIKNYMESHLVQEVIQQGLHRQKQTQKVEDAAEEIDAQVKEEKKAAQASQQLLKLMELVDGVSCHNGKIKGKSDFAKMFYEGKKEPQKLGITEDAVWNKIKDNMVNLRDVWEGMSDLQKVATFQKQVSACLEKTKNALEILHKLEKQESEVSLGTASITTLESNQWVLEQTQQLLSQYRNGKETISEDDIVETLKGVWKNYNTTGICFSYDGVKETGGAKNPVDHISQMLSGNLLDMVLDESIKLSDKSIKNPDGYSKLYGNEDTGVDCEKKQEDFAKKQEVNLQGALGDVAGKGVSQYLMCEYAKENFSYYGKEGKTSGCLDYEVEYLIGGKKSDRENLEQVVSRLFWMRAAANIAILMSTSSKRETAHGAALAIVGFTGMEPLIRLTQTMLLISWGMVEAMVDVAGVLQGKQVPLVKTAKDLVVEFPDLMQCNRAYVMKKAGQLPREKKSDFGYRDYLSLFLMTNQADTTSYRMMDVMQWNIRHNAVKNFDLGMCVSGFLAEGDFSYKTKFFRLPEIGQILERNLNDFFSHGEVFVAYVEES